jgi:hypothetical protein
MFDLTSPRELQELISYYGGRGPHIFSGLLDHAIALGATLAVVEYRYVDADYRDEHAHFYTTTFRRYPSVAHRLHLFTKGEADATVVSAALAKMPYHGYLVLRPVPGAPVGRCMIAPPNELLPHLPTLVRDTVNVFGAERSVNAVPFMAQDAQLSICAHTAVWVTAYQHHLATGHPRTLPGDIAKSVPEAAGLGRLTPARGLSVHQIAEAYRSIGLPALVYRLTELAGEVDIDALLCRYLNSGLPVTVTGGKHTFVLSGYRARHSNPGEPTVSYIRQDDEVGPYQLVEDRRQDPWGEWDFAIVPLPSKVYVSGEDAEQVGAERIAHQALTSPHERGRRFFELLEKRVTFRSSVISSNDFKVTLSARGMPENVAWLYQRIPMSRFVWVVEAVDRDEDAAGRRCVLAEAVIDATDHLRDQHVLAWRIPGEMWQWLPDEDEVRYDDELEDVDPILRLRPKRMLPLYNR